MKSLARAVSIPLFAVLLSGSVAFAQVPAPAGGTAAQPELDQMLAPIALYPDSLLSQILMASTYPLEVVEAARWSRANPDLEGNDAVAAVDPMDWDPSVKALTAFPQVLSMMDEHLEWTERLGDVFVAQEPQVMETVQSLRQKAYAAGNLRSSDQYYVSEQSDAIVIEPASPEVVYVPYYDPWVVYGTWWWPAYPPVYWARWPGYYAYPGFAFAWGVGITVGPRFFFSVCNWRERRVTVVNVTRVTNITNVNTVNRQFIVARATPVRTAPTVWHHDPAHRRGVPYHIASVQRQFGPRNAAFAGHGRAYRWHDSLAPATRNGALNRPQANDPYFRAKAPTPSGRPAPRVSGDAPRAYPAPRGGSYAPPHVASGGGFAPGYRVGAGRSQAAPVAPGPQRTANPRGVGYPQNYAPRPVAAGASGRAPEMRGSGNRGQGAYHRAPAGGRGEEHRH